MQKAVGVSLNKNAVVLYLAEDTAKGQRLFLATSKDGASFSPKHKALTLRPAVGQQIETGSFDAVRVSAANNGKPIVTFVKTSPSGTFLYCADAKREDYWSRVRRVSYIGEPAVWVQPEVKRKLVYFGQRQISWAIAGPKNTWKVSARPVLEPRQNFFDNAGISVGQARLTDQGIMLTYYARYADELHDVLTVGAALLNKHDPAKVLWRTDHPLWQQPKGYRHLHISPVGEVDLNGQSLLFLQSELGEVFSVVLPLWEGVARAKPHLRRPHLERSEKNPILKPRLENNWESKAAFNPAAFFAHGRVHLIYRAIGDDDVSSFGYASSADGVHFDERLGQPVYRPREHFEGYRMKRPVVPSAYASGGSGIGGCEDPRVSLIDDKLFMTYVAFDGYNPPRVALTSISLEDFLSHKWNWKEPVLITPYIPGEGNKNACILPEKIDGQYVIFHRIWPDILIDYVKDINFDGKKKFLSKGGHAKIKPRKLHWDSRKIGVGATPIKTDAGWLLIYQAVGHQDSSKYKIGAMLLDLQNPAKVIARAQVPVLEPEAWYENDGWKYGVVYPCGAAVVGKDLFVYYGGADTYTCVAKASLPEFLTHLLKHQPVSIAPVVL